MAAQLLTDHIQVTHFMPGRLRVKVARLKRNATLARRAEEQFGEIPGMRQVTANHMTGSLLLEFKHEVLESLPDIITVAQALELLPEEIESTAIMAAAFAHIAGEATEPIHVGQVVKTHFQRMDDAVKKATKGTIDFRGLLPAGLAALGVIALVRSKRIASPAWYALLWYSFGFLKEFYPGTFAAENKKAKGSHTETGVLL